MGMAHCLSERDGQVIQTDAVLAGFRAVRLVNQRHHRVLAELSRTVTHPKQSALSAHRFEPVLLRRSRITIRRHDVSSPAAGAPLA